jgi:hypothetical protein
VINSARQGTRMRWRRPAAAAGNNDKQIISRSLTVKEESKKRKEDYSTRDLELAMSL